MRDLPERIFRTSSITFCLVIIAIISCFEIATPDFFWHLRMGIDLLNKGLSPFRDHYSFTYANENVKLVAWPFQIVLAAFYEIFRDWLGICILRFLMWGIGFAFFYRLLNEILPSRVLRALGFLFFLSTLIYHTQPRPEQISQMLEPLLILLLFRWRQDPSLKRSAQIAGLLLVWSNCHSSSILAYVIAGGFLIDRAILLVRGKSTLSWRNFIAISAAWILVGFINADLRHPLFLQFDFDPAWKDLIIEYATIPFQRQQLSLQIYWILMAFTLPALLITGEWAGAVIVVTMAWNTWNMTKLFTHMMTSTSPFVLIGLQFYIDRIRRLDLRLGWAAMAGVLALAYFVGNESISGTLIHPIRPVTLGIDRDYLPYEAVDYMKANQLRGRVMNDYEYGGFLLEELSPDVQVYIDGRTNVLYPLDFMLKARKATVDVATFTQEVEKYSIDYVLGSLLGQANLIQTGLNSGLFSIEYVGRHSVLLKRGPTRFPLATYLFAHPECLEPSMMKRLIAEQSLLPQFSALHRFLGIAIDAIDTEVESVHLNQRRASSPFMRRIAAEIEWRRGDLLTAQSHIMQISQKSAMDFVNLAEIDCELTRCRNAESILNRVPSIGANQKPFLQRALAILQRTKEAQGLRVITDDRIDRIRRSIHLSELPNPHLARNEYCKTLLPPDPTP